MDNSDWSGWLWVIGIIGGLYFLGWLANLYNSAKSAKSRINELADENRSLQARVVEWEHYAKGLDRLDKQIDQKTSLFKALLAERTQNFPLVGKIWSQLISTTEEERARALAYKQRPALRAAEEIRKAGQEKRQLAKELTYWRHKAQNYEAIYPWLTEELEQDIQDQVDADIYFSVYSDRERDDPVARYVSPDDYRKLNASERNQLALDRYWQQGKKTKWMIGKMYERYIGYLYEVDGWVVDFFGIHKRFEDLGRDLIAHRGHQMHVVQCKNWSQFKTIYENHVFQLFGTSYSAQKENPKLSVTPVFYCSTGLSETADEFARRLGIEIHQHFKFKEYPCIKCNVSSSGEKIYHLPFDQQYDNTRIIKGTSDFYASSVQEAETAGFRRAYRWHGNGSIGQI